MPRSFATELASNHDQFRSANDLRLESQLCVHCREVARVVGLPKASERQVGMKPSLSARNTRLLAFIFQRAIKQGQPAGWIFDSDPENAWLTFGWECATASDDDFEWFNFAGGALCCLGNGFNVCNRSVAKEFQGEVQVLIANPTGSRIGKGTAQTVDVGSYLLADD